jgi:hypothetical protein
LLTALALAAAAAIGVYRKQRVPAEPAGTTQAP